MKASSKYGGVGVYLGYCLLPTNMGRYDRAWSGFRFFNERFGKIVTTTQSLLGGENKSRHFDRELSWLPLNERVLWQAKRFKPLSD
jgi:hypothetical protein